MSSGGNRVPAGSGFYGGFGSPGGLPLVGRQSELALLRRRLAGAGAGRGSLLILGAEAGAGISALVRAAVRLARGCAVGVGLCAGPGETPGFGPWRAAIAQLGPAEGQASKRPPLTGGRRFPGAEAAARELEEWLFALGRPALLALEDLHWADPDSLELLRSMAPRVSRLPLLLLVTHRTDELHRTHPLWSLLPILERQGAIRRTVGRLGPEQVVTLVRRLLPQCANPGDLARRLHEQSGGNPLFVHALIRDEQEAGQPASAWQESVTQAISRRLCSAGPIALRMLQAGAVIGEAFDLDLAARVADLPDADAARALADGARLGLVRPEPPARWAFAHTLVREGLLRCIVPLTRRRLHLRTGEALLAHPPADPDLVGFHLSRAGDPRGAGYLLLAAHQALGLGAHRTAEALLERALDLLPAADPRRGEVLLRLGFTISARDLPRMLECVEEAEVAAESAGDRVVAAVARSCRVVIAHRCGDAAGEWLHQAIRERVAAGTAQVLSEPRWRRLAQELLGPKWWRAEPGD